ncbi:PepSY-associated TM helix domain-containing protein [Serratia symbiotica]|uniref:PepSY domain-containing protein n=1 Tax=Serratia symbiotica TaxID=138074 RepID=A0A7D5NT39_9GAMM|nr:PepSY-associated TM helix domain-containing protein [Serratia symbiotica]MBF1995121.1 PepSY domain-containing protein [Serratia symbiotica]MBQ0956326.1 PepSY domain-containing protein [Serratia symbiotica]QLH64329.1 PepSY domain-containing protein [Serratia symbiotica]QTP15855.1 PepSY domain-containing protein [Serratia symbiotica]
MPEHISTLSVAAKNSKQRVTTGSWFIPLVKRIHFYIGLFVGPFLLLAALSGILYALTPQIESHLYARQLYNDSRGTVLPLQRQVSAAQAFAPSHAVLSAVRPSPVDGENTRVLFDVAGLQPAERLAVFVDPVTAQLQGTLIVYGTSGVLPLRTWLDQFHRSLLLGDLGRNYSELAASWLWVTALGGLILWGARQRRQAKASGKGLRRLHEKFGVLLLIGLLFFSVTGLTWSQWAGGNISMLRQQFGWATPSLSTVLGKEPVDEHAEHCGHEMHPPISLAPINGADYDRALAAARLAGIKAAKIEIKQPTPGRAWAVMEIDRSWPTQVDAVALDPVSMAVVERVSFAQYPLAAKLTRWGIDLHMGVLFGLANELVLVMFAAGLAAMVVTGYVMWWRTRPTRVVRQPQRSPLMLLRKTPIVPLLLIVSLTLLLGFCLPVMGISLLIFLLCDLIRYQLTKGKKRIER